MGRFRALADILVAAVAAISLTVRAVSGAPLPAGPEGFGAGTTGGSGGAVVRVTTPEQLKHELCRSVDAHGLCSDLEPRIIELVGVIDFTGRDGASARPGCDYGKVCEAPFQTERLVSPGSNDTHCDGRPIRQISFDAAGVRPLAVGSNKTLIGLGANATIRGKGLTLRSVRDVVIRNLTISDINAGIVFAGDALTLGNADHIWIDHDRFHNIGRQMIVGGYEPTTNVTISWNEFDGTSVFSHDCNGAHYWNLLLLGSPQSITLSHNYFHDFSGRAPKVEGPSAMVHLVDNYFRHGTWHALDAAESAKVLVEGNYFDDVKVPITASTHPGLIFGSRGEMDAAQQLRCRAALGRACAGNITASVPSVDGFALQDVVLEAFKAVPKAALAAPGAAKAAPARVMEKAGPGHL
ncbi:pectin lyase [Bradyrhizobium sp. SSBR45G]|nr:pectin lyase [Bradyrhizobium sp. SSBR45G]GLH85477.1 pectin lyase [Bradyrhizobium sp. SSBR45R]